MLFFLVYEFLFNVFVTFSYFLIFEFLEWLLPHQRSLWIYGKSAVSDIIEFNITEYLKFTCSRIIERLPLQLFNIQKVLA